MPASPVAQDRRPPGPPLRRGLAQNLRYYAAFSTDPTGFVEQRFKQYGDIYYAPATDGGLFVLKHPDHLRDLLITHAASYRKTHTALARLRTFLGDGLLTSDGADWTRQRRMVQPAFARTHLAGFARIMVEETDRTLTTWKGGETRDLGSNIMAMTLRSVSRCLFGQDSAGEVDAVARAMLTFQAEFARVDILPPWLPTPQRLRFRRALATIDRIVFAMIDAQRSDTTATSGHLLALLASAIDSEGDGAGLSREEVRDQLVTLFLAGHDTTSYALLWTMTLLAAHPEATKLLTAELDSVLAGRLPTLEDLPRLTYTEQVIKEAMRLYPPAYVLGRRAASDTEIGGYSVRAGSEVIAWIFMTHRDPRWFPEPEAFRPERFAPGAEANLPRLAYMPFGAGPRACIGRQFAMIEAQLMLARIYQKFTLELAPGHKVEPKFRITLMPKHGLRARLHARQP
ncbi:MAG TPA: cytochrome P450 [Nannocystis sp.]|jgi:cytochrome P450